MDFLMTLLWMQDVLLRISIDWKPFGWAISILAGFGAKIAFEVSEKLRRGEKIKKAYWLENICGAFVTYVIGYHSRGWIAGISSDAEKQAGMYAIVGVLGFSLFRILYRILTNKTLWDGIVRLLVARYIGKKDDDTNKTDTI